jgi:hypothetical protein
MGEIKAPIRGRLAQGLLWQNWDLDQVCLVLPKHLLSGLSFPALLALRGPSHPTSTPHQLTWGRQGEDPFSEL